MAIYHCSYKVGSKGKGQSAAAKADYILRDGKYSKRADEVIFSESGNMPACFREKPRSFWKANDAHSRKNGRLFSEFEFALPNEMKPEQQVDLARAFARKVTDRPCGEDVTLPYTLAIHQGDRNKKNVHCHLVFSDRGNDAVDRAPELWFKRANKKDPAKGGAAKVVGLKDRDWLQQSLADWATVANKHLEKGGYPARIDHRSLKDQGINRIPQIHVGPAAFRMDEKDLKPERLSRLHQILRTNRIDKKEAAALTATWEKHMAEGRQYEAAEGKREQMFGKDWRARLREGEKLNRAEMAQRKQKIFADLKQQREEERRRWDRQFAAAEKVAKVAEPAQKAGKTTKAAEEGIEPAHQTVMELTSTAVKPKKIAEDEQPAEAEKTGKDPAEIEGRGKLLRSLQAQLKQGQAQIKQQEAAKDLLKENLQEYKNEDAKRDGAKQKGHDHEME